MIWLRSALFNVLFFAWCVFLILTMWLLLPAPPRLMRRYVALWPVGTFPALRLITGIRMEVRGRERIPDGPVIFASKHQSAWDTMFFLWLHPDTAYVMKAELARIPLWGWYARRCRHVLVDRAGGMSAMREMVRRTREILAEGRSVIIFPQGTRTPPGEVGGPYHPGVAALYGQAGAPIVPVALNSGTVWPRRAFLKRPGTIVVEFQEPIPEGLERKAFMAELQRRIEEPTRLLESESRKA
jgi:1-acyl-sn-glycerol-3-phosphate acyltransferase